MRGTAKKVVGATSRTFSGTVSTLSAKLAIAPERSGRKVVKVRSAMWQSGRKASCSSSVPNGMKASALRSWKMTLRCEIIAPLGGPVVPDV